MSSSTAFSESFALSRWLHSPPESSIEQDLAAEAMQHLAVRLLASLDQQCREKIRRRCLEKQEVQQPQRIQQRQQRWRQRLQRNQRNQLHQQYQGLQDEQREQ